MSKYAGNIVNGDNVRTLLKAVKKGRYQNFPVLSSFAWFLDYLPNALFIIKSNCFKSSESLEKIDHQASVDVFLYAMK